jgi:copper chaperone CopZ
MGTYKFKTNVRCKGCIATVTPFLNRLERLKKWSVDLEDPRRILTAEGNDLIPEQIIRALEQAGYRAEQI